MCKPKFGFAEAEGAVLAPAPSFLPMLCLLGCWASVGTMLGQHWHNLGLLFSNFTVILWFALVFVGQEFGPYWVYLGPCWATLGHVGTILGSCLAIMGYFGSCFVHARCLQKTP